MSQNPKDWSDAELYAKCQEYGYHARIWKRRFAGLLGEVAQRSLYRRQGYASIYEFAFKLGSMSEASVDKILRLSEKLADKPNLHSMLVSGEQGWSKIEKVAFIATQETDAAWAKKVETMTQAGLESYVQTLREQGVDLTESTLPSELTLKSKKDAAWANFHFPVSPELERSLRMLKFKLEKERGVSLTYNEVLQTLMVQNGPSTPQMLIQICPECAAKKAAEAEGRSIPNSVQRLLFARYAGFCAFPNCKHPSTSFHHTRRFSLNRSHDPDAIIPLCTPHERLVHSGLIANEEDPPSQWRLLSRANSSHPKFQIDQKVQMFRKETRAMLPT
jgi:hypothetical protein